jgi:hypothetical protein
MAPIKVQLIPERSYTVKCGERRIEGMRVTGVWEGMTRLQGADGTVLVLEPLDGPLSRAFKDLLANADEDYQRASVVKGSPSLLVALAEPQNVAK